MESCYRTARGPDADPMAFDVVFFILLSLALGVKHSYDADHLVAVSNFLTRSGSLRKTSFMSLSWAAGHMITASIITVILFTFRETLLAPFLASIELIVAIMLIAIGIIGLLIEFEVLHSHRHQHADAEHAHAHLHMRPAREHRAMFGIGVVHGLASNDELLILFVASLGVTTLLGLLGGVGVFSLGVVLGMIVFGVGVSYPVLRWGSVRVRRIVNVAAALLSLGYGVYLLLGFEGLNLLPVVPG